MRSLALAAAAALAFVSFASAATPPGPYTIDHRSNRCVAANGTVVNTSLCGPHPFHWDSYGVCHAQSGNYVPLQNCVGLPMPPPHPTH
jgi:hypothetical protein